MCAKLLARVTRHPQHEYQHFGDGFVKLGRDFVAELDMGERAGEHLILLDRNAVGLGELDDLLAHHTSALGDHARRAGMVVMQSDRQRVFCVRAHSARSRKCPAGAETDCIGAPWRIAMSPGCNSARISASLNCAIPPCSCAAVPGRSAHIRTEGLSPNKKIAA